MSIRTQIANITARLPADCAKLSTAAAYRAGHRDMCRAAVVVASKADAVIDAARAVLAFQLDTPTRGDLRDNDQSRDALRTLSAAVAAVAVDDGDEPTDDNTHHQPGSDQM